MLLGRLAVVTQQKLQGKTSWSPDMCQRLYSCTGVEQSLMIIDLIVVHVSAGELNTPKQLVGQLVADTWLQNHDCEKFHAIGL